MMMKKGILKQSCSSIFVSASCWHIYNSYPKGFMVFRVFLFRQESISHPLCELRHTSLNEHTVNAL